MRLPQSTSRYCNHPVAERALALLYARDISSDIAGDVRFGSKADIGLPLIDVRFTPKSGHQLSALECPLCANTRHQEAYFDDLIGELEATGPVQL